MLGPLMRDEGMFISIVPNCSREDLLSIIQGKILEGNPKD
jgi:hypothetical protein